MISRKALHLVLIAYGDPEKRVEGFCNAVGRKAQISVLYGGHFGNLPDLVDNYLPKPAIDPISGRQAELLKNRGIDPASFAAGTPAPSSPPPTPP